MTAEQKAAYKEPPELYKRAANQQKSDKGKVYSLHKPFGAKSAFKSTLSCRVRSGS